MSAFDQLMSEVRRAGTWEAAGELPSRVIKALEDAEERLSAAQQEAQQLREALIFYADAKQYEKQTSYETCGGDLDTYYSWPVTRDGGARARAALADGGEAPNE